MRYVIEQSISIHFAPVQSTKISNIDNVVQNKWPERRSCGRVGHVLYSAIERINNMFESRIKVKQCGSWSFSEFRLAAICRPTTSKDEEYCYCNRQHHYHYTLHRSATPSTTIATTTTTNIHHHHRHHPLRSTITTTTITSA